MLAALAVALCLAAPTRAAAGHVTLAAAGDVMLGRGVGARIAQHGPAWPLAEAGPALRSADIAIANLECVLTDRPPAHVGISLPARPSSAKALRTAGISLVSLANNHSLDCGPSGLTDTIRTLHGVGVRGIGAGHGRNEAARALYTRARGVRFAFLAFLADMPGLRRPHSAGPTIALATPGTIAKSVTAARKQADIVLVSLHAGDEQSPRPTTQQERLAEEAVAAGADLVIGHHPHRLQALRVLPERGGRTALIAYSLGNFVFDTTIEADRDTVVLRCVFTKAGLIEAEVVPFRIVDGRPTKPSVERAKQILDRVAELSAERGTDVVDGRVRLGGGVPR